MFRGSDGQGDLFSAHTMYLDFVGRDSFYAFLANEGERLFPDERFESWYHADNGRPCVSPCMLTKVLLLQMYDRCSDAEAVDRATYDLRWKVALRVRPEERPFVKSTTPVFGRGAVKDTFNLVADAIKQLCRAMASANKQRPEAWASDNDFGRYWTASSLKGEADIDWSDENERQVFLNALIADVDRILIISDRLVESLTSTNAQARPIKEAAGLLRQIIAQDVDRSDGNGDGNGGARIKQEVAPDRIISVSDPDMRHGRKSASKRFDGHKANIAVEPDSQIITAAKITPGNGADAAPALEMVEMTEVITGQSVDKALGDCAYGDGATRRQFDDQGRMLVAKLPAPPRDQPFNKAHFHLDLDKGTATCPAGKTTSDCRFVADPHKRKEPGPLVKRFIFSKEVCDACPFLAACVTHKTKSYGRIVYLHPEEKLLQQARAYQKTDAFREDKKQRQAVEHRIARLVQLGIRQSRYFGRAKTELQLLLAAAVANLTLVHRSVINFLLALLALIMSAALDPRGSRGAAGVEG